MKKDYLYMNQNTYVPVSVLPFSNSGIGKLLVKGKIVNTLDCMDRIYFILCKIDGGLNWSAVCSLTTPALTHAPDKPQLLWAAFSGD